MVGSRFRVWKVFAMVVRDDVPSVRYLGCYERCLWVLMGVLEGMGGASAEQNGANEGTERVSNLRQGVDIGYP